MLSGINEKFSIPIAYHFINKLDSTQKMLLVRNILSKLIQTGVVITSITFDGLPTNKKMCMLLGANLDVYSKKFKPYFTIDGKQIFIFYDVCHAEKLVRGHMDKKNVLIDENGEEVCWSYIEHLVEFKYEKTFSGTHKLNRSHLEWRRRPMNVRSAVEVLSGKTANSMQYLREMGYKEFADSAATERFIRLYNDLFDIMNTKFTTQDNNNNIFKLKITNSNKSEIFNRFNEAIRYIKKLKFEEVAGKMKHICRSVAKAGFVGFIIDITSLQMMYNKYVENEKLIEFIPTYYLNQDPVEMFFGKVRSRSGFNDNPDVITFQGAYRKLLGIDSIRQSKAGNVEAYQINNDPFSDIIYVSSRRACAKNENDFIVSADIEKLYGKLDQLNASVQNGLGDDLGNYSIAHISNEIEDKIKSVDTCPHCISVFNTCTKVDASFCAGTFTKRPCLSTFKICQEADRFLKLQLLKGDIDFNIIYYTIINNIEIGEVFKESDFALHASHKHYLIRSIIDGYIHIKGIYIAKTATEELHTQKFRYKFKKLIHFYGQ